MLKVRLQRSNAILAILAMALNACGGAGPAPTGGSGPAATTSAVSAVPAATTPICSLRARQDWAAATLREWYLFPDSLPAALDPTPYPSVDAYIDALTATARAEGKDRFFTYLTSIAEEDAYFASGATAAFGIRLQTDTPARRVTIADAYEGAPALAAGIDRGTEILAIGTSPETLVTVASLIDAGGNALSNAFGPADAGVARTFRISDAAGTRNVSVTKADFSIPPVSPRFGTNILTADGERIGYINLRTFISTAETPLRAAFDGFRTAGITRVIVDFRYNGGGLLSQGYLLADLLGQNRAPGEILSFVTYRASKASNNQTRLFQPQPQSIAPMRIAFIATGSTASASELVINAFIPYLRTNAILVGANSFGKPVGQIAIDRRECDDRLRVMAFATQNADRQGDYFRGLAATVGASCAAGDQLAQPMGDPRETSTRVAIDALAGRACTPIEVESRPASLAAAGRRDPMLPDRPTAAQRDLPGTF